MSHVPRRLSPLWLAALLALVAACGKDQPAPLAELVRAERTVEGSIGGKPWSAAQLGDGFRLGDAVRTGAEATAELRLERGGALHLEPDTVVRFQSSPAQKLALDVEAGAIELESTGAPIELETSLGVAVVERRGTVRLRNDDKGLRIDVLVGTVTIDDDGKTVALGEGQSITIDVGGVIIEDDAPADTPTAASPDAGAPPPPKPAGGEVTATVDGRGTTVMTDEGWQPLDEGTAELASGTRMRVARKGTVELKRGAETAVVRGAAEIVVGASDGSLLEATDGDVVLQATTVEVRLIVPGGVIVARAQPGGSVAEVDVGDDSTVRARRGRVDVVRGDDDEQLRTGESAALTATGIDVTARAPKHADLTIEAGQTAVIHDPRAPTAVAVRFADACPGEGVVELTRRGRSFAKASMRSAGDGTANILVPPKRHSYRVMCAGADGLSAAAGKRGTLTVKNDSGRRQLPRGAPHNLVDADGRRYTVLYQNRLPELTFRWPRAPTTGGPVTLHIAPERGATRVISLASAKHKLASGELDEGSYTWWFEVGKMRSPNTRLAIDFDNAAATAYLKPAAVGANGKVSVEGAVIAGWTVSVRGKQLDLDRHRRFSAEVALGANDHAIPVRISHSQHGVHYYLVYPAR